MAASTTTSDQPNRGGVDTGIGIQLTCRPSDPMGGVADSSSIREELVYNNHPQTSEEVDWTDEDAIAMISEESW